MYDKEIVKQKLKKIYESYDPVKNWSDEQWDKVVSAPYEKDGFKIFRVESEGYIFIENTLIDYCPGYFLIPGIMDDLK